MSNDRQRKEGELQHIRDTMSSLMGGLFAHMEPGAEASNAATESAAIVPTTPSKKPRQPSAKLAKAAAQIVTRPDKTEAAYLARELVQCNLPHRDPGDVPAWVRRNGNFALVLQPGIDQKTLQPIGLPYGSIPRLLLLWIVTEAVREKKRHLKLGKTLNKFLREMGLDPNTGGGKFSHAKQLKEQMKRLLNCRISFQYSEGDATKGREARLNMEVARESRFWWDFHSPDQGSLFESEIILGEVFFEAITAAPVPVDMRAVAGLMRSPLALDLYTWATYRIHTLQGSGRREVSISLALLKEQLGGEYTRLDHFKAALTEALAKVQQVYPALDYTLEKSALVLRSGRRAVPPRDPQTRKALAQEAAREMSKQISAKAHEWFADNYAGWSIETAINDFEQWREYKSIEAGSTDALFKSFVRKWAR